MTNDKPKVFFDGGCPVCSKEISVYQKMDQDKIEWIDVTSESAPLPDNLSREAALGRFHVQGSNGQLYDGAAAFSHMWVNIPKTKWLGKISSLPVLSSFFEWAYRLFLKIRPLYRKP